MTANAPENRRSEAYRAGRGAETLAALTLRLKGYRIVARGYRSRVGEIDIVAERRGIVVFVEVKARATPTEAADALGNRQRRRIARAAEAFLAGRRGDFVGARFDVVLIVPGRLPRHLIDAWRPE